MPARRAARWAQTERLHDSGEPGLRRAVWGPDRVSLLHEGPTPSSLSLAGYSMSCEASQYIDQASTAATIDNAALHHELCIAASKQ